MRRWYRPHSPIRVQSYVWLLLGNSLLNAVVIQLSFWFPIRLVMGDTDYLRLGGL